MSSKFRLAILNNICFFREAKGSLLWSMLRLSKTKQTKLAYSTIRKFGGSVVARGYGHDLRRLVTSLSDHRGRHGLPRQWPASLHHLQLVVEPWVGGQVEKWLTSNDNALNSGNLLSNSRAVGRLIILYPRIDDLTSSYPEWLYRQGGCLACWSCRVDSRLNRGCTDLYYARGAQGVLLIRVGVRPVNWIYRIWRHCP